MGLTNKVFKKTMTINLNYFSGLTTNPVFIPFGDTSN